jgi:excisionase family DNA binding protein
MAKARLPFDRPAGSGFTLGRNTVSILQAKAAAGVCRRTIYNWLRSGRLEYVRTAGGSVRIFEDSLFRTPVRRADL